MSIIRNPHGLAYWKTPHGCLLKTYSLGNLIKELACPSFSASFHPPGVSHADMECVSQYTYNNKQCSKQHMLVCELCISETSIPAHWLLQFSFPFVHHPEATTSSVSAQEIVQSPPYIKETSNISALQNRTSTAIQNYLKTNWKQKPKPPHHYTTANVLVLHVKQA